MSEKFQIEITADFSTGETTGIFEAFTGQDGIEDTDEIRTGYLIDEGFDQALSVLTGLLEEGDPDRKGIHLDLGGGVHAVSIRADVTSGHKTDENGETLQWGSSRDPNQFDATTATGASALRKVQIFQHYSRVAKVDSLTPATLRYGEYHEDGVLEPLAVAFEQPKFTRRGPDTYEFTAAFVETADLDGALDGSQQTEW